MCSVIAVLIPYTLDLMGQTDLARELVGFLAPGLIAEMWASGPANAYEGFHKASDPRWLTPVIVYGVSILSWFLVAIVLTAIGGAIKRILGRKKNS